jgi:formylglycine-generating enzyme required for sulfatase activity
MTSALFPILLFVCSLPASAAVILDMAVIGDAGNAPDPVTGNQWGAVAYQYRMGKFEVTNAQYVDFLNAKAKTSDPYHLYDSQMSTDARGGVSRTTSGGISTYRVSTTDTTIIGSGGNVRNRPVVFVSLYSAMRFCNWLQNGQGNGDTETGAYTLFGGTPVPNNPDAIKRNPNATYFLPSHHEWYKAAYFQPASAGGDSDNYWFYPTRTNDLPNSDQPPGDPSIQTNVANFFYDDGVANGYNDGYAITGSTGLGNRNYMTDVGSYINASTYYGTFDQGGNAWEWIEPKQGVLYPNTARGGSWSGTRGNLRADAGGIVGAGSHGDLFRNFGFRVAAAIPEPTGVLPICLFGCLIRRFKRNAGQ